MTWPEALGIPAFILALLLGEAAIVWAAGQSKHDDSDDADPETKSRGEHRAQCIEAIGIGLAQLGIFISEGQAAAAFDSLPTAAARVVPVKPTDEMIGSGQTAEEDGMDLGRIFKAMAAAGDLTNPAEKKP